MGAMNKAAMVAEMGIMLVLGHMDLHSPKWSGCSYSSVPDLPTAVTNTAGVTIQHPGDRLTTLDHFFHGKDVESLLEEILVLVINCFSCRPYPPPFSLSIPPGPVALASFAYSNALSCLSPGLPGLPRI